MMELWLLEDLEVTQFVNDNICTTYYMEFVLHIPQTDIWLINTSLNGEHFEDARFTKLFWDTMGSTHMLTRIGTL